MKELNPLEMYQKVFPYTHLNFVQIDQIESEVTNLEVWKSVLYEWAGNGWRPQSVFKMLRMYEEKQIRSGAAYVGAESEHSIYQPPAPCERCQSTVCLGGKSCDDRAAALPQRLSTDIYVEH